MMRAPLLALVMLLCLVARAFATDCSPGTVGSAPSFSCPGTPTHDVGGSVPNWCCPSYATQPSCSTGGHVFACSLACGCDQTGACSPSACVCPSGQVDCSGTCQAPATNNCAPGQTFNSCTGACSGTATVTVVPPTVTDDIAKWSNTTGRLTPSSGWSISSGRKLTAGGLFDAASTLQPPAASTLQCCATGCAQTCAVGNVTAGNHQWVATCLSIGGGETPAGNFVADNVGAGPRAVVLNLPSCGPAGTSNGWNVYRTKATAPTGPYFLTDSFISTSPYTDVWTDALLTGVGHPAPPVANTANDLILEAGGVPSAIFTSPAGDVQFLHGVTVTGVTQANGGLGPASIQAANSFADSLCAIGQVLKKDSNNHWVCGTGGGTTPSTTVTSDIVTWSDAVGTLSASSGCKVVGSIITCTGSVPGFNLIGTESGALPFKFRERAGRYELVDQFNNAQEYTEFNGFSRPNIRIGYAGDQWCCQAQTGTASVCVGGSNIGHICFSNSNCPMRCTCSIGTDCGTGGVCTSGFCIAGDAGRTSCTSDAGCSIGQTCPSSTCQNCFGHTGCQTNADCVGHTTLPEGTTCTPELPAQGDSFLIQMGGLAYADSSGKLLNSDQLSVMGTDNEAGCIICAKGSSEGWLGQNPQFGAWMNDNRLRTTVGFMVSNWTGSLSGGPLLSVRKSFQTIYDPVHAPLLAANTCSSACGGAGACHLQPGQYWMSFAWMNPNTLGQTSGSPLSNAATVAYGQELTLTVKGFCDDGSNSRVIKAIPCQVDGDCPVGTCRSPLPAFGVSGSRILTFVGGPTIQLKNGEMTLTDCSNNACVAHICGIISGTSKCSNDSIKTCSEHLGTPGNSADCETGLATGSFPHGQCGNMWTKCGVPGVSAIKLCNGGVNNGLVCVGDGDCPMRCTCSTGTDCGTGGVCTSGFCIAGDAGRTSCTSATSCNTGQTCPASYCGGCHSDAACVAVNAGKMCIGGTKDGQACTTISDCPSGTACSAVCRGQISELEVPFKVNTTGLGLFDVYEDGKGVNADQPGRVVIRQPAADTLTDLLVFRDDQQRLRGVFDAGMRFKRYKTLGDTQPAFSFDDDAFGKPQLTVGAGTNVSPDIRERLGDDSFGNPSLTFGGTVPADLRLRWVGGGHLVVDRNNIQTVCNAGPNFNLPCSTDDTNTTTGCPGICSGGTNPGTLCEVYPDCGSGGTCSAGVCSGGPTPGKKCCYGTGGLCTFLPTCPGCCGEPATTLEVGAFNAAFSSVLQMWGPGPTQKTLKFDGTAFNFNAPVNVKGSASSDSTITLGNPVALQLDTGVLGLTGEVKFGGFGVTSPDTVLARINARELAVQGIGGTSQFDVERLQVGSAIDAEHTLAAPPAPTLACCASGCAGTCGIGNVPTGIHRWATTCLSLGGGETPLGAYVEDNLSGPKAVVLNLPTCGSTGTFAGWGIYRTKATAPTGPYYLTEQVYTPATTWPDVWPDTSLTGGGHPAPPSTNTANDLFIRAGDTLAAAVLSTGDVQLFHGLNVVGNTVMNSGLVATAPIVLATPSAQPGYVWTSSGTSGAGDWASANALPGCTVVNGALTCNSVTLDSTNHDITLSRPSADTFFITSANGYNGARLEFKNTGGHNDDTQWATGRQLTYGEGEQKFAGMGSPTDGPGAIFAGDIDNAPFSQFVHIGYVPALATSSEYRALPPWLIQSNYDYFQPFERTQGTKVGASLRSFREWYAVTPSPDIYAWDEQIHFGAARTIRPSPIGSGDLVACSGTARGVCWPRWQGYNAPLECTLADTATGSWKPWDGTHGGCGDTAASYCHGGTGTQTCHGGDRNGQSCTTNNNDNTTGCPNTTCIGLPTPGCCYRDCTTNDTNASTGCPGATCTGQPGCCYNADGCIFRANEACGPGVYPAGGKSGYCVETGAACNTSAECSGSTAFARRCEGAGLSLGFGPNARFYVGYNFEDYNDGDQRDPAVLARTYGAPDANCPSCLTPTNETAASRVGYFDTPATTGTVKVQLWLPKVCWDGAVVKKCSNTGATCTQDTDCTGGATWQVGMPICHPERKPCSSRLDCSNTTWIDACGYMPPGANAAVLFSEEGQATSSVQNAPRIFRFARVPRSCTNDNDCASGFTGSCETQLNSQKWCAGTWFRNPFQAENHQPHALTRTNRSFLDVYDPDAGTRTYCHGGSRDGLTCSVDSSSDATNGCPGIQCPHCCYVTPPPILGLRTLNALQPAFWVETYPFNRAFTIFGDGSVGIGAQETKLNAALGLGATTGDKIALYETGFGPHFGFGVNNTLLQMHTDVNTSDIGFGYGSSGSFNEMARIKNTGVFELNATANATNPIVQFDNGPAGGELQLSGGAALPDVKLYRSGTGRLTENAGTFIIEGGPIEAHGTLPTPTAPVTVALNGAGVITAGAHSWAYTCVSFSDTESLPYTETALSAVTSASTLTLNGSQKVTLTVPGCPPGAVGRHIFRTKADQPTVWCRDGSSLNDNYATGSTTATVPDGLADVQLDCFYPTHPTLNNADDMLFRLGGNLTFALTQAGNAQVFNALFLGPRIENGGGPLNWIRPFGTGGLGGLEFGVSGGGVLRTNGLTINQSPIYGADVDQARLTSSGGLILTDSLAFSPTNISSPDITLSRANDKSLVISGGPIAAAGTIPAPAAPVAHTGQPPYISGVLLTGTYQWAQACMGLGGGGLVHESQTPPSPPLSVTFTASSQIKLDLPPCPMGAIFRRLYRTKVNQSQFCVRMDITSDPSVTALNVLDNAVDGILNCNQNPATTNQADELMFKVGSTLVAAVDSGGGFDVFDRLNFGPLVPGVTPFDTGLHRSAPGVLTVIGNKLAVPALQITNGAGPNLCLQSDADGNGTWGPCGSMSGPNPGSTTAGMVPVFTDANGAILGTSPLRVLNNMVQVAGTVPTQTVAPTLSCCRAGSLNGAGDCATTCTVTNAIGVTAGVHSWYSTCLTLGGETNPSPIVTARLDNSAGGCTTSCQVNLTLQSCASNDDVIGRAVYRTLAGASAPFYRVIATSTLVGSVIDSFSDTAALDFQQGGVLSTASDLVFRTGGQVTAVADAVGRFDLIGSISTLNRLPMLRFSLPTITSTGAPAYPLRLRPESTSSLSTLTLDAEPVGGGSDLAAANLHVTGDVTVDGQIAFSALGGTPDVNLVRTAPGTLEVRGVATNAADTYLSVFPNATNIGPSVFTPIIFNAPLVFNNGNSQFSGIEIGGGATWLMTTNNGTQKHSIESNFIVQNSPAGTARNLGEFMALKYNPSLVAEQANVTVGRILGLYNAPLAYGGSTAWGYVGISEMTAVYDLVQLTQNTRVSTHHGLDYSDGGAAGGQQPVTVGLDVDDQTTSNKPIITAVTPVCTPGPCTTTWGYRVTALSAAGETLPGLERPTTSGAATLSSTNKNTITWLIIPGATGYNVYRTTGGTLGKITASPLSSATTSFIDTGIAAGTAVPTADTSGLNGFTVAAAVRSEITPGANKFFLVNEGGAPLEMAEISDPGTPDAGEQRCYIDAANGWCCTDSTGVKRCTAPVNGGPAILPPASAPITGTISTGTVNAGQHKWVVTCLGFGETDGAQSETTPSPTLTATLDVSLAKQVSLTLPACGLGAIGRLVYRTKASPDPDTTTFCQVGESLTEPSLPTAFVDNIADGSLNCSANPPTTNGTNELMFRSGGLLTAVADTAANLDVLNALNFGPVVNGRFDSTLHRGNPGEVLATGDLRATRILAHGTAGPGATPMVELSDDHDDRHDGGTVRVGAGDAESVIGIGRGAGGTLLLTGGPVMGADAIPKPDPVTISPYKEIVPPYALNSQAYPLVSSSNVTITITNSSVGLCTVSGGPCATTADCGGAGGTCTVFLHTGDRIRVKEHHHGLTTSGGTLHVVEATIASITNATHFTVTAAPDPPWTNAYYARLDSQISYSGGAVNPGVHKWLVKCLSLGTSSGLESYSTSSLPLIATLDPSTTKSVTLRLPKCGLGSAGYYLFRTKAPPASDTTTYCLVPPQGTGTGNNAEISLAMWCPTCESAQLPLGDADYLDYKDNTPDATLNCALRAEPSESSASDIFFGNSGDPSDPKTWNTLTAAVTGGNFWVFHQIILGPLPTDGSTGVANSISVDPDPSHPGNLSITGAENLNLTALTGSLNLVPGLTTTFVDFRGGPPTGPRLTADVGSATLQVLGGFRVTQTGDSQPRLSLGGAGVDDALRLGLANAVTDVTLYRPTAPTAAGPSMSAKAQTFYHEGGVVSGLATTPTPAAPTLSCCTTNPPCATTCSASGGVNAGSHVWGLSCFTPGGETTLATVTATLDASLTRSVTVTLPSCGLGGVRKGLYRTVAGTTTPFYLVSAPLVTAPTVLDTISDSSLVASPLYPQITQPPNDLLFRTGTSLSAAVDASGNLDVMNALRFGPEVTATRPYFDVQLHRAGTATLLLDSDLGGVAGLHITDGLIVDSVSNLNSVTVTGSLTMNGGIIFADGAGAITHIQGPTDQDLAITAGTGKLLNLTGAIRLTTGAGTSGLCFMSTNTFGDGTWQTCPSSTGGNGNITGPGSGTTVGMVPVYTTIGAGTAVGTSGCSITNGTETCTGLLLNGAVNSTFKLKPLTVPSLNTQLFVMQSSAGFNLVTINSEGTYSGKALTLTGASQPAVTGNAQGTANIIPTLNMAFGAGKGGNTTATNGTGGDGAQTTISAGAGGDTLGSGATTGGHGGPIDIEAGLGGTGIVGGAGGDITVNPGISLNGTVLQGPSGTLHLAAYDQPITIHDTSNGLVTTWTTAGAMQLFHDTNILGQPNFQLDTLQTTIPGIGTLVSSANTVTISNGTTTQLLTNDTITSAGQTATVIGITPPNTFVVSVNPFSPVLNNDTFTIIRQGGRVQFGLGQVGHAPDSALRRANDATATLLVTEGTRTYPLGGKETELDFGITPLRSKVFTITDAKVSTSSVIFVSQSGNAATGRSADENEMDAIVFSAQPGVGQFTVNATGTTGAVSGKYKVMYEIR